jgi:hypothetical protein
MNFSRLITVYYVSFVEVNFLTHKETILEVLTGLILGQMLGTWDNRKWSCRIVRGTITAGFAVVYSMVKPTGKNITERTVSRKIHDPVMAAKNDVTCTKIVTATA